MATQEMSFAKGALAKAAYKGGAATRYRDARYPNLYLEVGARWKTWCFRKFWKGRNFTETFGTWSQMSVIEASQKAAGTNTQVETAGIVIKGTRGANEVTLREALEQHVTQARDPRLRKISDETAAGYASHLRLHVPHWLDMPISDITRQMVNEKIKSMSNLPTTASGCCVCCLPSTAPNLHIGTTGSRIRKYLKDERPPCNQRHSPPVRHKLCNGFDTRVQELYEPDLKRPRRERRTAQKLYDQLVVEGYTGSYSPVQRFIRDLKHAGTGTGDAFVPLRFRSGDALQFDWSEEHVVLGGTAQKVKIAHFRLCHSRKPFVVAYMGEAQEMAPDAFVRALAYYGGVPRRVIIDNPRTMVTYVSRSKDRVFHPRFLAPSRQHAAHAPAGQRMNPYVMEPVACTPASG